MRESSMRRPQNSLRRLRGTQIETNICQGGQEHWKVFGLIDDAEVVRETIESEVKLQAADKHIAELEEDREHWRQQATRLLAHTDKEGQGFRKRLFG